MFSKFLLAHGHFCASHPWEVIFSILTMTICALSMAIYVSLDKICQWNIECPVVFETYIFKDEKSSDIIILTFTKCVAIFYIYLQFKKLRKLGSKYVLGLAGLFTIFSSFIISATVIKLLHMDLYYIKESIPFFLLLIDLSKASTLGKFALNYVNTVLHSKNNGNGENELSNSKNINKKFTKKSFQSNYKNLKDSANEHYTFEAIVQESIANSLTVLGPSFTLDTLVEIMVVGIGTISGIQTLEVACLFGCIAILVNYFLFMSFYPSCLSLVIQISHSNEFPIEVVNDENTDNKSTLVCQNMDSNIGFKALPKPNPCEQNVDFDMDNKCIKNIYNSKTLPLNNEKLRENKLLDDSKIFNFVFFKSLFDSFSKLFRSDSFYVKTELNDSDQEENLIADFRDSNAENKCLRHDLETYLLNRNNQKWFGKKNGQMLDNLHDIMEPHSDNFHANSNRINGKESFLLGNPVIQRIKVIMSLGLLIVHIHSRFFLSYYKSSSHPMAGRLGWTATIQKRLNLSSLSTNMHNNDNKIMIGEGKSLTPSGSLFIFLVTRIFDLKIEDYVTIIFGILTTLHYHFLHQSKPRTHTGDDVLDDNFDKSHITVREKANSHFPQKTSDHNNVLVRRDQNIVNFSTPDKQPLQKADNRRISFIIGESLGANDKIEKSDQAIQTEIEKSTLSLIHQENFAEPVVDRNFQLNSKDYNILQGYINKTIPSQNLDQVCGNDWEKAILIRRLAIAYNQKYGAVSCDENNLIDFINGLNDEYDGFSGIPFNGYRDYGLVSGACCENVIGFMPLPLGIVGPLIVNGRSYYVPMATTEGCLVASTNRGCRAITESVKHFSLTKQPQNQMESFSTLSTITSLAQTDFNNNDVCSTNGMPVPGVSAHLFGDGMSRGPVIKFPTAARAVAVKAWCEQPQNRIEISRIFEATSRFLTLTHLQFAIAGRRLYIRFKAQTGDAMGMNMMSKGCDTVLKFLASHHSDMEIVSVSGNFCVDKKASTLNWIEGRGKSVVCEALISQDVVSKVLKTTVPALVELNHDKNLVGSALSGTVAGSGCNAHAANIVAAIYIATGQDPAQVVTSSSCMTLMEYGGQHGQDLLISCTMPCLELGTVGGGTILSAQKACLKIMGVDGAHATKPGNNAILFAQIVCSAVLAGELSLLSALSAGHLVKSHLKYNRSQKNLNVSTS